MVTDRVVWVRLLGWIFSLYSWARHLILTLPPTMGTVEFNAGGSPAID